MVCTIAVQTFFYIFATKIIVDKLKLVLNK